MRRISIIKPLFCLSFASIIFFGCNSEPYIVPPPPVPDQSFIEEFDTATSAIARGWSFINRSEPTGIGDWVQAYSNVDKPYTLIDAYKPGAGGINYIGNILPAYLSQNPKSYITTSCYASAGTSPQGGGVISNWVVSPLVVMQNGDKVIFYTTSMDSVYTYDAVSASNGKPPNVLRKVSLINRLQVRINMHDESFNCGTGVTPGLFDVVLLDINSAYANNGYPYYKEHGWTRMEATVTGLAKPTRGRFAFRYFLEGGGPGTAEYGGVINIDKVVYVGKK
ncbi:MAG TPA: choice-of-anchor J domain-containing protein [Segetibacter sp.]|jgi:hypothetical protein